METWEWIAIAIVVVVAGFYVFGRAKALKPSEGVDVDEANTWASTEFRRSFPDERVVRVIGDTELETFFLNLANGRVGMFGTRRGKGQAIVVRQGEYRLRALPDANALQVDFPENDFFSANYQFRTEQDAADVSTWLLNAR